MLSLGPGTLQLFGDALRQIPPEEAIAFGEEPLQLQENGVAEWRLQGVPPGWRLREGGPIHTSRSTPRAGTIQAGNEAGLLSLRLEDETGRLQAQSGIEIVSVKLSYREDFRLLLEAVARHATDLLLRPRTDLTSPFAPALTDDPVRLTERFFLLRGLLESALFQHGLAQLLAAPQTQLLPAWEERPLSRTRRLTPAGVRWLATATPRQTVPSTHALRAHGLESVPLQLPQTRPTESYDTPENRFVGYALRQFIQALEHCAVTERLKNEAHRLTQPLRHALTHPLFATLSPLTQLPLSSKLWQWRSGYRELWQTWLAAQQALQLQWDGGQLVFGAGRRDVATLYEYWCFFEVAEAVERVFGVRLPYESLLTPTPQGTALTLRRGTELRLSTPSLCLTYNPTLRTWTRPVRPDMTLELGARRFHFDAKYRLSEHDDALTEDLLTMHAYRDAIPGTVAALALYPGTQSRWWQTENGTGGLGALPLSPRQSKSALRTFLDGIK